MPRRKKLTKQDFEDRREKRNARRRTRFVYIEMSIPLYDRPCGCQNSRYLPHGIMAFWHSDRLVGMGENDADIDECLQCGATWSFKLEIKKEDIHRIFDTTSDDTDTPASLRYSISN